MVRDEVLVDMTRRSECLVCRKPLEPGQKEVTTVKRGLLGFVNARFRNGNTLDSLLEGLVFPSPTIPISVFLGFPKPLQTNAGMVPEQRPWPIPLDERCVCGVVPECGGGGGGRSPRGPDDQQHRPTRGVPDRDRAPIALMEDKQSDRLTAAAPLNGTEIFAFTTFPDFCPRKDYTSPGTIKKDLSSENKSEDPDLGTERRLRSSEDVFNVKQYCLYCGEEASVRKETEEADSVVARALEPEGGGDVWGEIVHARTVSVADIVAAEAKYHKQHMNLRLWSTTEPIQVEARKDISNMPLTMLILISEPLQDMAHSTQWALTRYLHPPSADIIAARGKLQTNCYKKSALPGLKGINICELATVSDATARSVKNAISAADVLWSSARCLEESSAPPWNGFMRSCIHTGKINCSAVSFIHLYPSNRCTIYTALLFAVEECKRHNQASCIVTFDQPLYAKVSEIISAAPPGELDSITHRLGGFHPLVSFMGSIGFIMSGSGIEELWMQVYTSSSITHMISGHAFSRAVRAHTLTSQALITIILGMENLFGVYQEESHKLCLDVSTGERMILDTVESPLCSSAQHCLNKVVLATDGSSTCSRWTYWASLLEPKGLVIGNFIYSVCGQCCRTCMLLDTFTTLTQVTYMSSRRRNSHLECHHIKGFFTVRRKNEFWGGVWIDLSIELDLMRALKTKRGLTRGRGITGSTFAYFVAAFTVCLKLCNALEELPGIKTGSSEQHVELRDSHRSRCAHDVAVLLSWLKEHSPWDVDCLRSLASRVVGDDSINCDQAEYVGLGAIKRTLAQILKNRVKPLSAVARSILIRDDVVEVNSHQLFMRIVCVMKTESDLKHYLSYELSPRPPALFDEVAMRKTVKSTFLKLFSYTTPEENSTNDPRIVIIDGRHLLHALVWPRPATYGQIADAYLKFVQKHYRVSATVVFDGYNIQSTKSQGHFRRASKTTSAEIMFDMNTSVSTTQADFQSNRHNKERLITLLSHHFETTGIEVCNSEGDADTLIVKRALELASVGNNVTIVASLSQTLQSCC
ncbi:hypothetical protein PR048_016614 [Dryococelus australis]|uniref:Uncharacterized protein n=1 Tax=Dryococelus australis TaxID=614101 RepID=A0ABQ9H7A2_9NEOP|nr:hypothetical protein PR048_016614 [Dryococelus australis]